MKKFAAILSVVALAACAAPAVISDINDSAIKIQVNGLTPAAEIAHRAREGCAIYDKEPVPISQRCMDQYCSDRELLFACKATSGSSSVATAAAPRPVATGSYDGKWVGEGQDDGCGSPWAMELAVNGDQARGSLFRGPVKYDVYGAVGKDGRLDKALANKSASSNGIVGPRYLTVNADFQSSATSGEMVEPTYEIGRCTAAVVITRHRI